MKNLHPRIVELLGKQLPGVWQITGAISVDDTESMILVKQGPTKSQFKLPKSDIALRYPNSATTITVESGATFKDVLAKLSNRDGLFLLPGVDYENSPQPVEFDSNGKGEVSFVVLSDSIVYTGGIKVNVVLSEKALVTNTKAFTLPLAYEKIALALVRKVFTVNGQVFTGNQLTKAFCKTVIDYLASFNFELYDKALEEMQQGEVLSVHNDGVSDILTLRTQSGISYLIRFKTKSDDTPAL